MAEKTDNSMLIVGIIILLILTIGLTYYITKTAAVAPPSSQTNATGQPTITVTGEATRTVTPDLLSIVFTMKTFGLSTSNSDTLNAAETAKVKAALLAAGLNESEISSQSYSTSPVYNQSCYDCYGVVVPQSAAADEAAKGSTSSGAVSVPIAPPYPCSYNENCTIIGYQTTHQILITSGNTTEGGKYIDAVLKSSNSTNVDYVYFSLKEETRLQIEAELQIEAAASAKTKADNIAKGLGARLGKIVSVNPNEYPISPIYAYSSGTNTKATPPTEIFPTSTTLSNDVTVVYELVQ